MTVSIEGFDIKNTLDILNTIHTKQKCFCRIAGEKLLCNARGISWIHWKINTRTNKKTKG